MVAISENSLAKLNTYLLSKGYEVDTKKVGYRVMMFKKDNIQHTQGYCNDIGIHIKFTGPELKALREFIDEVEHA